MRIPIAAGVAAASFIVLAASANAQQRDVFDPFGVRSGWQTSYPEQIFMPGPPSKTSTSSAYATDAGFGYYDSMPGRR